MLVAAITRGTGDAQVVAIASSSPAISCTGPDRCGMSGTSIGTRPVSALKRSYSLVHPRGGAGARCEGSPRRTCDPSTRHKRLHDGRWGADALPAGMCSAPRRTRFAPLLGGPGGQELGPIGRHRDRGMTRSGTRAPQPDSASGACVGRCFVGFAGSTGASLSARWVRPCVPTRAGGCCRETSKSESPERVFEDEPTRR